MPMNLNQLKNKSDTVVIAKYISEINSTKEPYENIQYSTLKRIELIKGNIKSNFIVKATKVMACVPNYIFPKNYNGQYLLFLKKSPKSNIYIIINGGCGVLSIINNTIEPCRNPSNKKNFHGLSIK
jgi:hypothetical protein